jgi:microcystin-dependent protein
MALDFPNAPNPGDIWDRWRWDGSKWMSRPSVSAEPPIGEIIDWPSNDDPGEGWLVCDGRLADRRFDHVLFSMWGEFFGPGNYVTTFNLPDLRGRMLIGLDPQGTGRVTVMDVANTWARGGSGSVARHSHSVSGGWHGHGIHDPQHLHGVSQPGVHGHGFHDPTHHHGTHQTEHSHGNADPGHNHGKSDPTHTHLQGHSWDTRRSWYPTHWYQFVQGGNVHTDNRWVGIWNEGSGGNVNVHDDNAQVWGEGAGTGHYTDAVAANLAVYAAHTNVSMQAAVSGVQWLAGGGGFGADGGQNNYQPYVELARIVRSRGAGPASAPVPRDTPLDFPVNPPWGTVYGAWWWDGNRWDQRAHGLTPGGTRIGMIADWTAWPYVPPGYLVCDGHWELISSYPRLNAVLGGRFGTDGNGFGLPDLRARVTVGVDHYATGRLTVGISGLEPHWISWAGGDQRLGGHSHVIAGDPGHAHGLNDPGHAHGVYQDAHGHGFGGGYHNHGIGQNPHAHGQSGGWHGHGQQGGWHAHGQHHGWFPDYGWIDWADYWSVVWGDYWIGYSGSNVGNQSSGWGGWTGGGYAWIDVSGAGTGQWIDGNWVLDVGLAWGVTGVWAHGANAADGFVIELNDGGDTANIAPSMVLPKLIYAGM